MKFQCGAAREIITPPVGGQLYGYRPDLYSESVHDDLTVTAVLLANEKDEALVLSVTVGDISTEMADRCRRAAAEASGVPFAHILCAATHTHSAPNVAGLEGWGKADEGYAGGIFLPAIARAAARAKAALADAEMGVRVTESRVGVNRRVQFEDGSVDFGQTPWAPFDPNMTLVTFRRADTKAGIVNLVHYGCHGTANGEDTAITRDWSGEMIDRLEEKTSTLTCFINGAMGDVGPRISNGKTIGDISYVEELGKIAARDILAAEAQPVTYTVPKLTLHEDRVSLPYQNMPALEEVEREIASFTDVKNLVYVSALRYKHLCDMREVLKTVPLDKREQSFTFDECAIEVGDLVLFHAPFELFTEIVMRLRAYSGKKYTLPTSGVNGYDCYLPTESELCRGGYEVEMFRYSRPYALADDSDANMIRELLRILRSK